MMILRFLSLLLVAKLTVDGATTPCLGYSKGAFSGDVISQEICETACETAEGLPKPDFKMNQCENATTYECSCLRVDNNGNQVERRGLCDDGGCASRAAALFIAWAPLLVAVLALGFFS